MSARASRRQPAASDRHVTGFSPWDYGADSDPSPARVCVAGGGRTTIVPMIGAPDVLLFHGLLYFRTTLFLSGYSDPRFVYTEVAPTLSERRAAEAAFREDDEEQ